MIGLESATAAVLDAWASLQEALSCANGRVPCREEHPELWWEPATAEEAVSRCLAACPALGACRAYAVAARERDGVWGGTLPPARGERRGASVVVEGGAA